MLIKFESKRAAPFQMQQAVAEQLLSLMGQGGNLEGSISGAELEAALKRLDAALASHAEEKLDPDDEEAREHVSLSARANPLKAMLQHARNTQSYLMWSPD